MNGVSKVPFRYAAEQVASALTDTLAILLLAMVALVCFAAGLRYLGGISMPWVDETLVFGLVAIAFLGAPRVSLNDLHLRMNLLSTRLSGRVATIISFGERLLTIAVCGFVGWHSLAVVMRLWSSGTRSNMAGIPLWSAHSLVLVGLFGIVIVAIIKLWPTAVLPGDEPSTQR